LPAKRESSVVRRRALWLAAAAFIGVGAWNIGHGAYIHAKAQLAQYLLREAWAETQAGRLKAKPWPWADTYPVARLTAPEQGIDLIVLAGASGRTMAFGPGHVDGTPLPGEAGNSVLSGHRDTHFSFLRNARRDELLIVERSNGKRTRFAVFETRVVDQHDLSVLHDTDTAQLTLVTCYPFDAIRPGGPLRYVVVARAIPAEPSSIQHPAAS
jgi:sortase A